MKFNTSLYGSQLIYPVVDREAEFLELVPNGITYPSKGEWFVPFTDDNHYFGLTNISNTANYPISINTLYPDVYGKQSLKPGKYTIHFQQFNNPTRNTTKDYTFEVIMGEVNVGFSDYNTGQVISSIKRGQKVKISGKNTDGPDTYLWLKGYGLPECGTNLFPSSLPVYSSSPTKLNASILNNPNSPYKGEYHSDGTWELVWDTSSLPLLGGQSYSVYASSINPEEILPLLPPRGSCTTTEKGLCAFESCPNCEPISDPAIIELQDPSPIAVTVDPVIVSPCCCQGYPCGSSDSADQITLKMKTGVSRLPVQIWMFGDGAIGGRGFLFNDEFTTLLDDEGTFSLDINQYLLEPNEIKLCDLEEGNYTVVVHVPYVTTSGDEIFDVTLETSKFASRIPNAMFPRDQDSSHLYVVQSNPLYWTKAFPVEGPGSYSGNEALSRLKSVLSESFVRDKFATATFTLNPNYCPDRKSVNFEADIQDGLAPLTVSFKDKSSYTGVSYLWDFGDNSTSSDKDPKHIYQSPGSYSVRLTLTDGQGAILDRYKPSFIVVKAITPQYFDPVADFTYSKIDAEPLSVQFIDQSFGSTPLGYVWEFGDSALSIDKSPKHTYSEVGNFHVTLTVKDQFNKISTINKTVTVPPLNSPVAKFNVTVNPGNPKQIQFSDKSLGEITSWKWTFGDGLGSSIQSPEHLYSDYGTYSVTLNVGNSAGSSSVTKELAIENLMVKSGFKWENIGDRTIRFTDTSEGSIKNWILEFGDGNIQKFSSQWGTFDHKYAQLGNYYAKLIVTNDIDSDSYSDKIELYS
ncbi:MAG: PKD domain-containing protein [Methanospirillum sp.]